MALATRPRLLLLDEPMAGMGADESQRMVRLPRRAQGPAHHRAGRARHGRGVRARRPHLRAGLRPHHRHRHAGGDPRQPRGAQRLPRRGARPDARASTRLEAAYGASQVLFGVVVRASRAGEVVTLLGRNGMGKTTTVRAIMGIVPPKAGAVQLRRAAARRPAVVPRRAGRASAWCPRGGRSSRTSPCARTSSRPPRTAARGPIRGRSRRCSRCSRSSPQRAAQHGQPALRRRAADARDRPRADDQPEAADPGRGDRGPGAAGPRGDLALASSASRRPGCRSWSSTRT